MSKILNKIEVDQTKELNADIEESMKGIESIDEIFKEFDAEKSSTVTQGVESKDNMIGELIEITSGNIDIIKTQLEVFIRDTKISFGDVRSNSFLFSKLFCKHYKDNVWFYNGELYNTRFEMNGELHYIYSIGFEKKERSNLGKIYLPISIGKYYSQDSSDNLRQYLLDTNYRKFEDKYTSHILVITYILIVIFITKYHPHIDIGQTELMILVGLTVFPMLSLRNFIYRIRLKLIHK